MKTKVLVGVLLFLILVNLGTIGVYVFRLIRPAPPEGFRIDRDGQPGLALRPEAREHLRGVMEKFQTESRDLQKEAERIEDSTVAFLCMENVPMERVQSSLRELADVRLRLSTHAVASLLAAKPYLRPEEQSAFFRSVVHARPRHAGPMAPPTWMPDRPRVDGRAPLPGPDFRDSIHHP